MWSIIFIIMHFHYQFLVLHWVTWCIWHLLSMILINETNKDSMLCCLVRRQFAE